MAPTKIKIVTNVTPVNCNPEPKIEKIVWSIDARAKIRLNSRVPYK